MGGGSDVRPDHHISLLARLLGSSCSGMLEIAIFHPFDTMGKRLMSSQEKMMRPDMKASDFYQVGNRVIFRESSSLPYMARWVSLYKGVSAALAYKISQRIYRFAGQPMMAEFVHQNYGSSFQTMFGRKHAKPAMHALSGALVGVGEIMIVPLDVLKIKKQTNPEAVRGRGFFKLCKDEGFNLYRGSFWTAARNGPGSFALFGGAALAKDHIFQLEDYNAASWWQNFVASCCGAVSCILIANPLDVIKTRVQSRDFDRPESGIKILKEMVQKEGVGAFTKGITPKFLVVGPKLIFAFTTAQMFIQWFDTMFKS